MKIEVNIEKKYFVILLSAVIITGGVFAVFAFGGNQPSVVGHSVSEIDWSQPIQSGININPAGGPNPIGGLSVDVGTFDNLANAQNSYFIRVRDLGAGSSVPFLVRGDGVVVTGGQVGVGRSPDAGFMLDVNGNARVSQGVDPNYDSGWTLVDVRPKVLYNQFTLPQDQYYQFTHNLGSVPRNVIIHACGAVAGNDCTSIEVIVGQTGYRDNGVSVNPVTVNSDKNNIWVGMTGSWPAWYYWRINNGVSQWGCWGDSDNDCKTAYYRVYAWT